MERMPAGTISLYPSGSAIARTKGAPAPPAGYGFTAFEQDRRCTFEACGQINAGATPNVKTENLAELVALQRAMLWARSFAHAMGRPILIRYTSEYAMRIATGQWRARKHKAMAADAHRTWKALRQNSKGHVYFKHVPASSTSHARSLAERGRHGDLRYHSGYAAKVD